MLCWLRFRSFYYLLGYILWYNSTGWYMKTHTCIANSQIQDSSERCWWQVWRKRRWHGSNNIVTILLFFFCLLRLHTHTHYYISLSLRPSSHFTLSRAHRFSRAFFSAIHGIFVGHPRWDCRSVRQSYHVEMLWSRRSLLFYLTCPWRTCSMFNHQLNTVVRRENSACPPQH